MGDKKYGISSLRFKIVISTVIVEVLMLSLLIWNSVRLTSDNLISQTEYRIRELLPLLNASVAGPLLQEDIATLHEILRQLINKNGILYIAVYNEEGNLIYKQGVSNASAQTGKPFRQHVESNSAILPYSKIIPVVLSGHEIGKIQIEMDTEFLNNAVSTVRKQGVVIAVGAVLISSIILIIISIILTRHLLSLTNSVRKFSENRLIPVIDLSSKDEINTLYLAFSDMATQISQRERERETAEKALKDSEKQVRLLLDSTAEAIYGIDDEGKCTFANQACSSILGYKSTQDLIGKNMHATIHYKHANGVFYPSEKCLINKSFIKGTKEHCDKEVFWRADNSSFPVEYWAHPIFENNKAIGSVVTFMDISERKTAEREINNHRYHLQELVSERTVALEVSNKELESYSYSIAHDLRTPLRAVTSFSQILLEDASAKLSENEHDTLNRIIRAGKKMATLIDVILELSQISRQEINKQKIDLSTIAERSRANLQDTWNSRKVEWVINKDLVAMGDPHQMEIVMDNLFGNAWKYTRKTKLPKIEFGMLKSEKENIFYVKDNGVGFDMQYADKLFSVFQRLHPNEEYEGVGIGLATVSRIIHRHGGRVWAEGKHNMGATFFFTLENSLENIAKTS